MKNISLMKMSSIVIAATLAANFVSASEEVTATKNPAFVKLLSQLDTDKNGLLDRSEILTSNNKTLKETFNKIDSDNNAQISEKEFNQFSLPVKTQAVATLSKPMANK